MASSPAASGDKNEERRKQVMLGTLPNDFLRVTPTQAQSQEEADRAAAMHMQHQMMAQSRQALVGRLQVSIVSAVLNKNYGMTRMDPYVRMRIGHHIYETQTDVNGAKNPRWNKTFQVYQVPKGTNTMHIEIFDERTLTDDELIAWINLQIPEVIYQGETVDEWYSLNGKLGEGQEGTINIVLSYSTAPAPVAPVVMLPSTGMYTYPGFASVPVYTLPPAQQPTSTSPQPRPISEEDLKQLGEMFPAVDAEVLKSVLEASYGNKEVAINNLLQMQDT
ncbi:hypothetical protein SK128_011838 [Halocaridina rubra]|uniref:Toll-interacting protein n=1 Tax=Halocaridina rubra TaxID=373956 RepID=A0AAN8ZZP8_HALRR